jgi:hypothetical protein
MITIDVKIFNGLAPLPIRVYIDNINNFNDIRFSKNESFTESFSLTKGEYYIIISGSNPINGKTIISISGTDASNAVVDFNKTKTTEFYSSIFFVKI